MSHRKGRVAWNKGKKNCFSEDSIKKMSIRKNGISLSEEECKKSNHFQKGYVPWNKGMKYAIDMRKKVGRGHKKENNYVYYSPNRALQCSIRDIIEYDNWRRVIFTRDSFRCTECFNDKYRLVAHHKKHFVNLVREFLLEYNQFSPIEDKETLLRLAITYKPFWDIGNGTTLCERCHIGKHKIRRIHGKVNQIR